MPFEIVFFFCLHLVISVVVVHMVLYHVVSFLFKYQQFIA